MASYRPIAGSVSGSVSSSSSGIHHLNFPFGDTTHTKVFVGGLAWETNSEGLLRHFEQYGEILEAVVITDKTTGRSKGYGFVTFRDPGAARRACADPNPIIDGRRANCNLASLGRPAVSPYHVRPRSANPYFGAVPATRGPYFGSHAYQQTIPYYYQQGFAYPSYGYGPYGPEFVYSQNIRNTYMHPYVQVHGIPGTVNPSVYPFGAFVQPLPSSHGPQGYALPANQQVMQLSRPNLTGVAAGSISPIQMPYPPGMAVVPAQPPFLVASPSPQFSQGSASDQMAG